MIQRGEVWWADLDVPRGSEPGYVRPILVVSGDLYNASTLRTAIVVAMTSNLRLAALPGNVTIPAALAGLPRDSVANMTQIATVDRTALTGQLAQLPDWLMEQVDHGLRRALALSR